MRKSFTRLFSVFMLLSLFCISAVLGANPVFDGANSIPKVNANNVKPADVTSFVVMFDKAITLTASGGTFAIYDGASLLLKTIPVPSASVVLGADGKSLVINPGMTLTPGEYHLALTAGTVKDSDGATNAAIVEATGWNFVLGDYVAPKLLAGSNFTPKDDAAHLLPGSFTLVFDEAVAAGTGNIVVYRADGVVVDMIAASAATYVGANVTFTPAPTDGFKDMTGYYVKVEAGAIVDNRNELDVAGAVTGVFNHNKFAGISDNTTYNFSTKDFTAPVIDAKSVTPASTSATLSVTLNEVGKVKYIVRAAAAAAPTAADILAGAGVNVAAGTVDVTAASTATTGNIGGLTTDTSYKVYLATTVTYSSASPAYTVDGTTVVTVEFKTSDGSAPSIISALNNTARINSDDKKTTGIKVHYNEQVVPGTGVITIRRSSDNFGYLNIDASTLTVKKISDTDYEVTIPFATPLVSDISYYVVMPQGVVKDMQNNPSNEVTQLTGFFITGLDFTVPLVESVAFSTDPSLLSNTIIITLSEQLTLDGATPIADGATITDDNLKIAFEVNNAPVAGADLITYNNSGISKSTITITPSTALSPNTTYSIRVRPGVFSDNNANKITSELSYTLTTRDLGPFTSAYSVPTISGGANNGKIAKDAKITVTFEKMPMVVSGSSTVAATSENLAALVTFQKVAAPNVNIPFTLAFGINSSTGKYEAVITPTSSLESDIAITFDMDETKLKDSQGNVFGAVTALTGTVADWKSPTVTMKSTGNIYFPTAVDFAIEFNEVMYAAGSALVDGSVSNLVTVKMTDANGANVPLTSVLYATATKKITIVPAAPGLEFGKTYYYAIGSSLTDAAGNAIAATSATFTYNDTQVVKAIATSPSKGQTGVVLTGNSSDELAVSVTFDQVVGLIVGKTDAERTAYLLPVGSTTIVPGTTPEHIIVDGDVVNSTLSFKFTALNSGTFNALPTGSKWYVYIPSGIIRSSAQATLLFAGFPLTLADGTGDAWPANYFVAKDLAKPTATYNGPTVSVALDADLTYTFNEEVVKGSGNILIKRGTTTELTIDVNSGSVELSTTAGISSIVIKHAALTHYSTAYTVEFSSVDAFKDKAGNSLSSIAGVAVGSFTTVGNSAPTAVYTPAPGSDVVPLNTNLSIKFSEPVDKVTGKIIALWKWDESLSTPAWALVENILAENTFVSAEVVTINPVADLLANTKYAVQIQTGAYKDKSLPAPGDDFAGIAALDYTTWTFSTKNVNTPEAIFAYVKRSDDKVATASNIVITFNKPIEKADGSAITNDDIPSLFSLKQTVNGAGPVLTLPIALTFNGIISDDKTTVTLNGASYTPALVSLAGYNISVVADVIRGTTNHGLIGSLNSNFTVSDYTSPTATVPGVVSFDETKIKFSLASNENGKIYYTLMAGDAGTAAPSAATLMAGSSVDYSGSAKEVEFTGLTSQSSYVIFVVATDAMGNVSDVAKKVQATKDITAPALLTKSTMFDKTAKTLSLTFNEPVSVSGNAVVYDKATMTKVATLALVIDGTDNKKVNTVAWSGLSALTNVITDMPMTVQEFYVEVENVNITDQAPSPNKFAGLYSTAWLVTTADQTAPAKATAAPNDVKPTANSGIKLDEVFTIEFNEDVKLVDPMPVSAVVVEEWDAVGLAYVPYEIVANVTAANKVVTIDPSRLFKEVTQYRITVLANTVSDLAGNKYAASVVKVFTTLDATPASVTWSPDGSASVAASLTTLTITFDQAITQLNGTAIESFDLDSLVTLTTTAASVPANTKTLSLANQITITIPGGLKTGTAYTYGFKAKFKGADGVAIPAQSKTFQTVQSPESIVITPLDNDADNATRIPITVDQTFTVSANLPFFTWSGTAIDNNLAVTAAYAKTAIKLYPGGTTTGAIDLNVVVSADGRTISLTPVSALNSSNGSATYDIVILPGLLQLGTSNASAVNATNIVKGYVTVDVDKPVVDAGADTAPFADGYAPANTGIVGKTSALKLAFNENVMSGAGAIEIRRQDGVLVKSVDAAAITYDNKIATILSDMTELPVNQLYYVVIPSGVITDKSGNPYVGISGITAWTFTLKDDVTPQATYTPNNVSGISVNTNLELTFDRPVVSNPGTTAPTSWIAIYKADGNAVELIKPTAYPTKVMYSADGMTATIDINTLEQNTTYNVEVSAGAMRSTTAVDFLGVDKTMWSFSTEDNTAPLAIEFTPADGEAIDLWENTLTVKFDKNIAKGTGKIYVRLANGDLVQEFDVTSEDVTVADDMLSFTVDGLMVASDYYVIIENTAITNTSTTPEKFAGLLIPTAWTFSTNGDDIAPTAEYAPNGVLAVDLVPADVVLTMTFAEPVLTGLGNLVIYDAVADTVVETIAIEESMVVDTVVTVVPTMLAEGISYYVMVDAGAVKDLAGNDYEGIADKATWTFATGDFTAPVATLSPNAETIADNHPILVMTFDEDVVLGDGTLKIFEAGSTSSVISIPVRLATIDGNVVTFTYETQNGLKINTDYYVQVSAGALDDIAGNSFAGITDATTWTFKTGPVYATGIEDPKNASKFKVYPNPFVGFVNVDNASKLSRIVVTNIAGQTVKEVVNPTNRIQLNELRSGIYFMSLYNTDNVIEKTAKIVKR